jgi:hypothetical protein
MDVTDAIENNIVHADKGAVWHIYRSEDVHRLRGLLAVGFPDAGNAGPIHWQQSYLDAADRQAFHEATGVFPYRIYEEPVSVSRQFPTFREQGTSIYAQPRCTTSETLAESRRS